MKTFDTARRDVSLKEGVLAKPLDCTQLAGWRRKVVYPEGTEVYYRASTAESLADDQLRVYVPISVTQLDWIDPLPAEYVTEKEAK